MVVLVFSPAFASCCSKVSCRHFLPSYENVALISPGLGSRYLFEDQNGVLHVPVHEMQLGVGANGLPLWTSLNEAVNGRGLLQKGHQVLLRHMEHKWSQ